MGTVVLVMLAMLLLNEIIGFLFGLLAGTLYYLTKGGKKDE